MSSGHRNGGAEKPRRFHFQGKVKRTEMQIKRKEYERLLLRDSQLTTLESLGFVLTSTTKTGDREYKNILMNVPLPALNDLLALRRRPDGYHSLFGFGDGGFGNVVPKNKDGVFYDVMLYNRLTK